MVSCVTGKNLDLLKQFLNILPPGTPHSERERLAQDMTEFQIDELYSVPDVGTVVGGIIHRFVLLMLSSSFFIRALERFTSHFTCRLVSLPLSTILPSQKVNLSLLLNLVSKPELLKIMVGDKMICYLLFLSFEAESFFCCGFRGSIREGDHLMLGPTDEGIYKEVMVKTVHRNRLPCRLIQAGQAACVALADVEREELRKVTCIHHFLF